MNDKLLTVEQVSEYLGVHRDTVYAMIRSGRLPALQLGGRKASWRISESDLLAFLASRKAAGEGNQKRGEQSIEDEQAEERARFERDQQRESAAFQLEQERRRAEFEARQRSKRERGDGDADLRVSVDGAGSDGSRPNR